ECVTAIAFEHFADESVQVAIFETGLGGRLDATNIVTPRVSVITRIDFDHENFLGHSLTEIAAEKAGIIKPGVPAVIAEQQEATRALLLDRAAELDSPLVETATAYAAESKSVENGCVRATLKEVSTGHTFAVAPGLAGRFQLQNAANAIAAVRLLSTQGFTVNDA